MNSETPSTQSTTEQSIRQITTNSLAYWEQLRIPYNLLLLGITIYHIAPVASHFGFRSDMPELLALTVAANVLYCFAYIPDVFIQISLFRERWLRWRWLLFLLGSALAAFFTDAIASGIALSIATSGW